VTSDLQYERPVTDRLKAFIGGGLTYNSTTNSSIGNEPILNIPGYALLDARAGVASIDGAWRATVWGKNITNKFYTTNILRGFDTIIRYTGRPVSYGISLSYRFQ
jgi:iron complex outermembrane recepter protein